MLTELQKSWIDGLLSGTFKQGTGCLRSKEDRYCCLGVACAVAGLKWNDDLVDVYRVDSELVKEGGYRDGGYSVGFLPENLKKSLGLSTEVMDILVDMNDGQAWSFNKIANWLKLLFEEGEAVAINHSSRYSDIRLLT